MQQQLLDCYHLRKTIETKAFNLDIKQYYNIERDKAPRGPAYCQQAAPEKCRKIGTLDMVDKMSMFRIKCQSKNSGSVQCKQPISNLSKRHRKKPFIVARMHALHVLCALLSQLNR